MKIALVVHGRFHAFDLAKALLRRGHDVTVFTNYPVWAARRFGLPPSCIRSFWIHGVLYRVLYRLSRSGLRFDTSALLNPLFGWWAARQIAKGSYDITHCFTGVAVELLAKGRSRPFPRAVHLIVRGSAHIRTQDEILKEEEIRAQRQIERPSPKIMDRELTEYANADRIVTLSTFAYKSFLNQGVSKERLVLLPLGVETSQFRASEEVLKARLQRISSGAPLRILWVGTMSLRKGLLDYIEVVKALPGKDFEFRFVGDIPESLAPLAAKISDRVKFIPRQPQASLRPQYEWADLFIFPTIEDGFAVVLCQAAANGLPILATTNCAGPDLISDGSTGWILPIRNPEAFIERLRWCVDHRPAVALMAESIYRNFVPRSWDSVAIDFEHICESVRRPAAALV